MFVCKVGMRTKPLLLCFIESKLFSFVKPPTLKKQVSLVSYCKIKNQRNMSQVPGLGHVTSCFYSTLFHSPLVGVYQTTLATCTLSFPREARRKNKLWTLKDIGHDRSYLSLDSTKEAEKGTRVPHICCLCF